MNPNRGRGRRTPNERQHSTHGGRGRARGPGQSPVQIYVPIGTKGSSSNKDELLHPGGQKSLNNTEGSLSNMGSDLLNSNCSCQHDSLGGPKDISSAISKLKLEDSQGTIVNRAPEQDCFRISVSEPAKHAHQLTSQPKYKDRDRHSRKIPKAQPLQFNSSPASDNAAKQDDPFHAGGTASRFLEKVVQYEHASDEKASKTEGSLWKQEPSNCSYQQDCTLGGTEHIPSDTTKLKLAEDSQGTMVNSPLQLNCSRVSVSKPARNARQLTSHAKFKDSDQWTFLKPRALHMDSSPTSINAAKQDDGSHAEAGTSSGFLDQGDQYEKTPDEKAPNTGGSDNSDGQSMRVIFDLCPASSVSRTNLNAPLHKHNREKRNEIKRSAEGKNLIELRSGMLLLKGYLSLDEQVEIVKRCRDFGMGPGGFYEPGYRDGGKLHLKMMCLGKNWDPETSKYGDERPADGAKPPLIPHGFLQLVKRAIQESHSFLKGRSKSCNEEYILPSLNPNICIVNFYSKSGRLGLHQDKDESSQSIRRGLPVVSLSIGDSAEFLYGDHRDVERADKVALESGDVLIFGGKSRLVFHGVSTIVPDSAPKVLMAETCMRPGRLNLTFREY